MRRVLLLCDLVALVLLLQAAGCGRHRTAPVSPDDPPLFDGGQIPATDAGSDGESSCAISWSCGTAPDGRHLCRSKSPSGGLPPGGKDWRCHPRFVYSDPMAWDGDTIRWICHGQAATPGVLPSGCGWSCRQVPSGTGQNLVRCEMEGEEIPQGGENARWCKFVSGAEKNCWVCARSSALRGTLCERVGGGRTPGPPKVGEPCRQGHKAWCDGLLYDGWGQVTCDPATGTWRTRIIDGKPVMDCKELSDGRRPDTLCACYHYFAEYSCCERQDCVVPDGTDGRICSPGGGGLCDLCNPQAPYCKGSGSRCVTSNASESFCATSCGQSSCPAGYQCMEVKGKAGSTKQCVPDDLSCYY